MNPRFLFMQITPKKQRS